MADLLLLNLYNKYDYTFFSTWAKKGGTLRFASCLASQNVFANRTFYGKLLTYIHMQ